MTSSELDDLITVQEAADLLKVPKSWLYDRTRVGAVPVKKLGRHLRFSVRELAEWVDQQRVIEEEKPPDQGNQHVPADHQGEGGQGKAVPCPQGPPDGGTSETKHPLAFLGLS